MFGRLRHTLQVARPRSITRMQKSLDHVVEGMRALRLAVKEQAERDKAMALRQQRETGELAARTAEMNVRIAELKKTIELLALRETQLRAVATADAALQDALADLAPPMAHRSGTMRSPRSCSDTSINFGLDRPKPPSTRF
jgi:hypothetical protein